MLACILTKENVNERYMIDNEAQVMMARTGDAIVRFWPRQPPDRRGNDGGAGRGWGK